jgi:hypothetical protein
MKKNKWQNIFVIFSLACACASNILAQEQTISPQAIKKAVKEAIKEAQNEESKEQELFYAKLKIKLDAALNNWIALQKKKESLRMNQLLHDKWEMVAKRTTPIPYDYYLRDVVYFVTKKDVLKTSSLKSPYQGLVEVTEKKYVERYHSPDAADISDYFHTVVRPIQMQLDYRQEKFIITDTADGEICIVSGWQK